MNNLYLTGIMGCGKTTVGMKAARILKAQFFDVDHEAEKKEGVSIRAIFERGGEAAFRRIESKILFDLSVQSGAMISTGGGIILRRENVDQMKATGKIVWIKRPVESILSGINASARPLIRDDPQKLALIYGEREPLYQKYADVIVDNNASMQDAVEAVVEFYRRLNRN